MSPWIEPLESRQLLSSVPHLAPSSSQLVFEQTQGYQTATQTLTLKNSGSGRLTIKSITLGGANAGQFIVNGIRTRKVTLSRGASVKVTVSFMPYGIAVSGAVLRVDSNDPAYPITAIPLRGLGVSGKFGESEPSLQRILDTFQIPVNVGDGNPATVLLDGPLASDEVPMQLLQKAGAGPVTITPLAAFTWDTSPVSTLGWYTPGATPNAHGLFSIPGGNAQTLMPVALGTTQFDPGSVAFGVFGSWPFEKHNATFSQDALNTWDQIDAGQHAVRFYPYKTATGQVVPNNYIVAMEQGTNSDFQDAVLLIQNVMPG